MAEAEFARVGLAINASVSHSFGSREAEFTPLIQAAKANGCDVFCAFTYPDEVWAVTRTAIDEEYDPGAFVCGPGANFGLYAAPPYSGLNVTQVEGVMCFAVSNYDTPKPAGATITMAEMYDKIAYAVETRLGAPHESGIGQGVLDWWGHPCYWAALEMWKAAVEQVGYVSQSKLKDALAGTKAHPLPTVFGTDLVHDIRDRGGIMAYECHTGEIGQWINGVVEIIGSASVKGVPLATALPNYMVTEPYVYPIDLYPPEP